MTVDRQCDKNCANTIIDSSLLRLLYPVGEQTQDYKRNKKGFSLISLLLIKYHNDMSSNHITGSMVTIIAKKCWHKSHNCCRVESYIEMLIYSICSVKAFDEKSNIGLLLVYTSEGIWIQIYPVRCSHPKWNDLAMGSLHNSDLRFKANIGQERKIKGPFLTPGALLEPHQSPNSAFILTSTKHL